MDFHLKDCYVELIAYGGELMQEKVLTFSLCDPCRSFVIPCKIICDTN